MHGLRGSVFIVLAVFALLLVQSAYGRVLAPYPFTPVLGLPIVFALGIAPGVRVLRGAATAFAIGYLYDLFTGNPLGIHTFVFVLAFLTAWLIGRLLSFRGVPFEMILTLVLTLSAVGLVEMIRRFTPGGLSWAGPALALSLIGSSVLTAVVAPLLFALTRRIDPTVERGPT